MRNFLGRITSLTPIAAGAAIGMIVLGDRVDRRWKL